MEAKGSKVKNLNVREIDGRWWVVILGSYQRVFATYNKSFATAKEAFEKMHELEAERT